MFGTSLGCARALLPFGHVVLAWHHADDLHDAACYPALSAARLMLVCQGDCGSMRVPCQVQHFELSLADSWCR
jgi:hypothetical protein